VVNLFLKGLGHTSIGSACDPTNASVCANSVGEKRKGSKYGSLNRAVPNAEHDTLSRHLMERLRHRVKLHNPLRNAINLQGEDRARNWSTILLAALERATAVLGTGGEDASCLDWQIQRFGEPLYIVTL